MKSPVTWSLSGLDRNPALLDTVSGLRPGMEMGQEIRLRAVACASPSTSCEAVTLDKGTLMFIVKMLLGKIRLWMVSLAKLLFPTASRQWALNGEPSKAGPRGLREEFADSDSTQDLCPGEVTGQRQIRGEFVYFQMHT